MTSGSYNSGRGVRGAARLCLGAVFTYLGLIKALDPVAFLKLLRVFEILPGPLLLTFTAAVLPWLEVLCGALLVVGLKTRPAAFVALILLVVFSAIVAVHAGVLYRSGQMPFCAVTFDCGCGNGEVAICGKLAQNVALGLLAWFVCWTPTGGERRRSAST